MYLLKDAKQYKKIFLLYFLILCLSSLIAPVIKACLDAFVLSSPFLIDLLHYKHGSYDFGRVMRRIIMVVAILIVFLFRKPLMIHSFATVGIKRCEGWREQLQMGFLLGTGVFIAYIAFLFAIGTRTLQIDAKSVGDLIAQLFKILLVAGIVGCIEEIFFRGFILQSFLHDMRTTSAVGMSSLFYSFLHFFKAKILVTPGIQSFVGFVVTYQSCKNMIINFTAILPSVIGLFLVGAVLSYACIRTKSLYFAIGLHAGWVFLIKANRLFLDYAGTNREWLFGNSDVVNGVLGWILLIFTLILIPLVTKTPAYGKNTAGTC